MKEKFFSVVLWFAIFSVSCEKDRPGTYLAAHQYPAEIRDIILPNCATPGCHTKASKEAAGGLDLSTWDALFEGGSSGAVIVPYSDRFSYFLNFINADSLLGPIDKPQMPYLKDPLSKEQYLTIRDWILKGAPDVNERKRFEGPFPYAKFYVLNQGCDVVGVYDAKSGLAMRYFEVGQDPSRIESPHMIKASEDGRFLYVVFLSSNILQRISTESESIKSNLFIGDGYWNTISISPDGKKAYCVDWNAYGKIAVIDLEKFSLEAVWSGLFTNPHGNAVGPEGLFLYVTAQQGNYIYKVDVSDPFNQEKISLQPGMLPSDVASLDPHEICFSRSMDKYFVTCQRSNEVRVMDAAADSLLAVIQVGSFPQEPVVSKSTDYVFVTCMEGSLWNPDAQGSVAVINAKTNQFVTEILTGTQPHGIAVDDDKKRVYVANRNVRSDGPAPHHSTACGGRNGYLTAISLETLTKTGFFSETAVDPFSIAVK